MKKLFAATLAAILILSAAGCAKKPVQQEEPAAPVQEEAIVPEAPAEAEKSQDNVIHITPNQNQTQDGLEASWLDEPERIQTDLEEIVSCTYTLPSRRRIRPNTRTACSSKQRRTSGATSLLVSATV